ncbi:MAG: hypothetical protein HRU19_15815 [Pseudobacteriovorax sp.]|nr:hypothetical protein [Pseudobacteriovorax sp.]
MKILIAIGMLLSTHALAQRADNLEDLKEQFVDYRQNNRAIYGGAPITHLSPAKNTITYALGIEYPKYNITP